MHKCCLFVIVVVNVSWAFGRNVTFLAALYSIQCPRPAATQKAHVIRSGDKEQQEELFNTTQSEDEQYERIWMETDCEDGSQSSDRRVSENVVLD